MTFTKEQKQTIFNEYGLHEKDTGSSEAQVAQLTYRINHLTEHMKENPKDFATRRGLTTLVGQRRRHQAYLKQRMSPEQYKDFIQKLDLRK